MISKKRVLSAVVGLSMLGIPPGAIAAINFNPSPVRVASVWQAPLQGSPVVLAYEDNGYEWHHHHYRSDPNYYYHSGPNDYYWGGRYRYQHPPAWFNSPAPGGSASSRRAYLEERRRAAIDMQQQMLARGDTKAADRLGVVIGQLNHQLGYR